MNNLNGRISAILQFSLIIQSANSLSIHHRRLGTHPLPLQQSAQEKSKKRPIPRNRRTTSITRRNWCNERLLASIPLLTTAAAIYPSASVAAETIGKDPNCVDSLCVGVWDGLLADCPHGKIAMNLGAGCASSQDDTPGIFAEPWDYSEAPNNTLDWEEQMSILIPAIQAVSSRRSDKINSLTQSGRYLRVLFIDGKTGEESTGEFYFTPNDTTVQFRVGSSSGNNRTASLKNLQRCESIRKQLRYTKLTVLRNRKRTFFFGESDLDAFGPGSAALGPPAEMTTGELEGRQDVDPKLKIDFVQSFPRR